MGWSGDALSDVALCDGAVLARAVRSLLAAADSSRVAAAGAGTCTFGVELNGFGGRVCC